MSQPLRKIGVGDMRQGVKLAGVWLDAGTVEAVRVDAARQADVMYRNGHDRIGRSWDELWTACAGALGRLQGWGVMIPAENVQVRFPVSPSGLAQVQLLYGAMLLMDGRGEVAEVDMDAVRAMRVRFMERVRVGV